MSRYFRFYGRIADSPDKHEADTLKVIRANAPGLDLISGERIWSELKKILVGNLAHSLVKTMTEAGLNPHLGLPEQVNLDEMESVNLLSFEPYHHSVVYRIKTDSHIFAGSKACQSQQLES